MAEWVYMRLPARGALGLVSPTRAEHNETQHTAAWMQQTVLGWGPRDDEAGCGSKQNNSR